MREFLLAAAATWGILYLCTAFILMDFLWHTRIFEDSGKGFVLRLVMLLSVIISLVFASASISGGAGD